MKRAVAVMGAVAMLLVAASAFAQGKTDFSGKWAPEAPAAGAPAGGGGGGGRGGGGQAGPMTITQTATELKIERAGQDGAMMPATVYKLDGSEFTVMQGQNEAKGKASWDGAKLKIEITAANGLRTQVYSLEGGKLLVTTIAPPRGGGEAVPTTRTYTKG